MVKENKELNRFEVKLKEDIEALMNKHKVKFSVFLPVLRDDMPTDRSSNEYKNKHKAEYLKQLRASYTVEEIVKMLNVLGYELTFCRGKTKIAPLNYEVITQKIKYYELMVICEFLGISIEWVKTGDRATPAKTLF